VNSNPDEIREIFDTVKTIAVLGLSPNETKASHRVAKYLQEAGYKIVPVYPKEETILGEKVYRSLAEIPFEIDMVDISVLHTHRHRCTLWGQDADRGR
jgi:predicted CoA-binding protein